MVTYVAVHLQDRTEEAVNGRVYVKGQGSVCRLNYLEIGSKSIS
jgi:hypothetical protein